MMLINVYKFIVEKLKRKNVNKIRFTNKLLTYYPPTGNICNSLKVNKLQLPNSSYHHIHSDY